MTHGKNTDKICADFAVIVLGFMVFTYGSSLYAGFDYSGVYDGGSLYLVCVPCLVVSMNMYFSYCNDVLVCICHVQVLVSSNILYSPTNMIILFDTDKNM